MIHELRRYTVKPGKLRRLRRSPARSAGRPRRPLRHLVGYWSTELGPLNQVVHLWGTRTSRRGRPGAGGPREGRALE